MLIALSGFPALSFWTDGVGQPANVTVSFRFAMP
jgi:hypothetical protein